MHRLIADQLLQERRGRAPVELAQLQEADVEPVRQEAAEVGLQALERRRLLLPAEQFGAQVDDGPWARAGFVGSKKSSSVLPSSVGSNEQPK